MEADDSVALPTRVKHERSPSPQPATDTQGSKRQVYEATGVVRAPVEFPWRTCQDSGDFERLKIKEKAVKLAEEHCEKIRVVLESALGEIPENPDSKEAVMMGQKIINQWLTEHDNVRKAHKDLEILVGVEGPTGAGKSSFLGSLLRIPELFPSGQESAATAVVGKVSWKWDDDPEHAFRAKIIFRNKADVEADLESLLEELNHYSDMINNKFDGQDDDAISQADAKIESRNKIDHEVPKFKAVWGLGERDLAGFARRCPEKQTYSEAVQAILSKNRRALYFLSKGVIEIHKVSAKELSERIKPYLDSSTVKYGKEDEFSPWPLVEEVHIYTKADILKSGITLVDLPGCGDATAGRSEIAQKFSHRLDVRMVVSPIIRATDERQGQELMQSGFDEAQMRIRGKLDGNGFGIIISKMDELKVDTYIAGCDELNDDQEIFEKQDKHALLKEEKKTLKSMNATVKEKKKRAESQKKRAQRLYESAKKKHALKLQANPNESDQHVLKLRAIRDKQAEAYEQADKELDAHESRQRQVGQEMSYLKHWLHHRAIQTRNNRVMRHIRADFAERQNRFNDDGNTGQSQSEQEYVLPILPVSTKVFWQLVNNDSPDAGFPDERFTGIPAAEQWLHRATLGKREKHLDEILDGYQSLMTMMRIYSQTNGQDGDFDFTRAEVEAAVAETHVIFFKKLATKLAMACVEIKKLDPLEHRERAMKKFIAEAENIVFRWAYKFPEDSSPVKLHWGTYYANIARQGQKYTSYSKPRVTYNWIESLASPVLKIVGKDWDSKMNKKLPRIRVPMMNGFSEIWTEYLDQLQKDINTKVPSLEVTFTNMRPILNNSQRSTENKIRSTLGKLSQKASSVTFDAVDFLTEEMKPTFQAALEDSGTGSYRRRRKLIMDKVSKDVEPMCNELLNRLATGLEAKKAEVPGQLKEIAADAIRGVKQQLSFLVNNLVENSPADSENYESKAELQKNVRDLIEAWEETWAQEGGYEKHILDEDLSIPDEVPELELEEEDIQYDDDIAMDDEDYDDEA